MEAYSTDLRKKVIKFIEQGNTQKQAAEVFNLNKATVNRWWLRNKREGHVSPRKNMGKKPKVSKEEFEIYVAQNDDFTTAEMGKYFNITSAGALYWLKKFGYSYKKKAIPTWKQAKKREIITKKALKT